MTHVSSLCLAVLLVAAAYPAAAQVRPDSLRLLPAFSVPVRGDFRPPHTSAVRAYLYSAGATDALVGVGYVAYRIGRQGDPTGPYQFDVSGVLMAVGAIGGPLVGNLSLGAGDAARRSATIKGVGVALGAGLVAVGIASTLTCIGSGCSENPLAVGLVSTGTVVAAGTVAIGTIYDLATIPANACWAREARARGNRVPVVAPTVGVRRGAPVLGLRTRF